MDYVNKFSKFNKLNEDDKEFIKDIDDIIEEADAAFWSVITEYYPEISTGDLPIEAKMDLEDAQLKAVNTWLDFNKK
jgi:hypothetical protein